MKNCISCSTIFLAISLFAFISNVNAQNKSSVRFNKEAAYEWLNTKLNLSPSDPVNERGTMEIRTPSIRNGQYHCKINHCKFDYPSQPLVLGSNIIRANLTDLNPNNLQSKLVDDKFYLIATATDTKNKVIREIYDSNGKLEESREEYQIWIGPFPNSLDDINKQKIKSVLSRLITASGGKNDSF